MGYWFIDEYGFCLCKPAPYNLTDHGECDAIGRTFEYFFINSPIKETRINDSLSGIYNCWYLQSYPKRHPKWAVDDMSRDHAIYTGLTMLEAGGVNIALPKELFKWCISQKYSHTIDSWLWLKSLTKRNGVIKDRVFYSFLHTIVELFTLAPTALWHNLWLKISGFGPEPHQRDYVKMLNKDKSKWVWFCRSKLFPSYTIYQKCWQVYYMPKGLRKWLMTKLLSTVIYEHNYMCKLLLGKKVAKADIDSYRPMSADRWSGCLNGYINDRDMDFLPPEEYQDFALDRDLLLALYNKVT